MTTIWILFHIFGEGPKKQLDQSLVRASTQVFSTEEKCESARQKATLTLPDPASSEIKTWKSFKCVKVEID